MNYVSTRGNGEPVDFTSAMLTGLAPDGGLYVPERVPTLPEAWTDWNYQQAVAGALELFGSHDVEIAVLGAAARFDHPTRANSPTA